MKKLVATLLICSVVTPVLADDEWTGHASIYAGQKVLDSNDWKSVSNGGEIDKQNSGGTITDFKKQSWPVSIAIDVIGSGKESTRNGRKTEGYTAEIDLGVRKIWTLSELPLQPYVGGGLAFVSAGKEQTASGYHTDIDDDAIGTWAGAGVYWNITERFNIGADIRYTSAEVELAGVDVKAGGFNAGITAGFGW